MLDRPLVVVDLKTAGLPARYGDRVVEIGLLGEQEIEGSNGPG